MHVRNTLTVTVALTVLLCVGLVLPALAQDPPTALQSYWINNYSTFNPATTTAFDWSVLAKAQPDECFFGVGDPNNAASFYANYPANLPTGYTRPCSFSTGTNGIPKVNQAYLWGLTKNRNNLWFGTIANTLCIVMEGMGLNQPLLENTLVCEGGFNDTRTPRIFMYDTVMNKLTDKSPLVVADPTSFGRLQQTIGLRSAGSLGDMVFLGGIGFHGVNMFAFDGRTGDFIGSMNFPTYSNIRQWIVVNGELYVGVATGHSFSSIGGSDAGEILHWIGNTTSPFQFENVGDVPRRSCLPHRI